MKSLQMNVKDYVEFDRKFVREGPEFRCYNCGKWFTRLLYWTDKQFNPQQKYKLQFLCGSGCATEKYERSNK